MQHIKHAGSTNNAASTVIKVLSAQSTLSWVSPAENEVFKITRDAMLPDIVFEFKSSVAGQYKWSWSIEWKAKVSGLRERARKGKAIRTFKESGSFESGESVWKASFSDKVLGGALTVKVVVGETTLVRTVLIKGQNPDAESVAIYVATLEGMSGFEKLLQQETGSKHFINFDSEPIVAFDQGYGITQMTNPAPVYEQVWNWKANVLAGFSIFKSKVRTAKKYLGQADRTYTEDQLRHEVFCRWNGGAYHEWDTASASWVRRSNTLCDSNTGNIGWSMDNPNNQGKTEAELRERDKDTYGKGKSDEHPWNYSGVCYADHVMGQ